MYHRVNDGWTPDTHLAAFQLDVLNLLFWSKTEAAVNNKGRPEKTPRPGVVVEVAENSSDAMVMSIGDYMKRLNGEET